MRPIGPTELFVIFAIALLLFAGKRLPEIVQAFLDAISNFRGGPPPAHPLPANDGLLLTRRRTRKPADH